MKTKKFCLVVLLIGIANVWMVCKTVGEPLICRKSRSILNYFEQRGYKILGPVELIKVKEEQIKFFTPTKVISLRVNDKKLSIYTTSCKKLTLSRLKQLLKRQRELFVYVCSNKGRDVIIIVQGGYGNEKTANY